MNNILSFADNDIKNKKLYSSILNNRIELLNINEIKLIIQDARIIMPSQKYITKLNQK